MNGMIAFVVGALIGGALAWRWASAKLRDANRSTIADLRGLVGSRDSTITGLRNVVAARDDHVAQLRGELEVAQQVRTTADQQLAEQERELADVRSALANAQHAHAAAESNLENARQACATAEQQLAEREGRLTELRAELDTVSQAHALVRGDLMENAQRIEAANQRLFEFVRQFADELGNTCAGLRGAAADTGVVPNQQEASETEPLAAALGESAASSSVLESSLPSLAGRSNGQHVM